MSQEGLHNNIDNFPSESDRLGDFREDFGDFPDELQEFEEFFKGFNNEKLKQSFVNIYSTSGLNGQIIDYLDPDLGTGFPINEKKLHDFVKKYSKFNIDAGSEDVKQETGTIVQENGTIEQGHELKKEKIDFLHDYLSDNSQIYKEFYDLNPDASVDDISEFLEKNYENILLEAQEKGGKEFVEIFEKFDEANKSGFLSLTNLDSYREKYVSLKVALSSDNAYSEEAIDDVIDIVTDNSSSISSLRIDGNTITYGDQILDISKRPPVLSIKTSGSNIHLESMTLDYRENKEDAKERRTLNRELKSNTVELGKINSQLNTLRAQKEGISTLNLANADILDALYKKYIHVPDIKQKIESLDGDENNLAKQDSLRSALTITTETELTEVLQAKVEIENRNIQIENKLAEIETSRETKLSLYKERVKFSTERTRKISEILKRSGLGLLPEVYTQELIKRLNSDDTVRGSIDLGNGYGIFEQINLSTGEFGQKDGQLMEETIGRLVNKMISGDPTDPLSIQSIASGYNGYENRDDFIARLNNEDESTGGYNIISSGGFNWEQVMRNLSKPIVENGQ